MLAFLAACVRGRMNILISGGTSSGKTTLLGVLSSFVPSEERLINIEDAAELRLAQSTSSVWRPDRRPCERRKTELKSTTDGLDGEGDPRSPLSPFALFLSLSS